MTPEQRKRVAEITANESWVFDKKDYEHVINMLHYLAARNTFEVDEYAHRIQEAIDYGKVESLERLVLELSDE